MSYAPIAVFIFRRPEHLRNTLTSLLACPEAASSPIFVFGDGPRSSADEAGVIAARKVAKDVLGTRAEYRFNDKNIGLARSIMSGVDELTRTFGRAIVIEDDLLLNPSFLTFLNLGLERYADEDRVWQISGHMIDVPNIRARGKAVFLPHSTSWGWATWRRAWQRFDVDATGWQELKRDRGMRRRFNLDGAYDYASALERQMRGASDSWAIRWYWSIFRNNGACLFPPKSLVDNRGFDGSGTHGRGRLANFGQSVAEPIEITSQQLPSEVKIVPQDNLEYMRELWQANGAWFGYATRQARSLIDRARS